MAIIQDLVTRSRRVLGDMDRLRWTDARMLDIVNSGLKDMNKITGAYRGEHIFEIQKHRYRYPLPTDLFEVTSIWHKGKQVELIDRVQAHRDLCATKSQLNLGVLELVNLPLQPCNSYRKARFFQSPTLLGDPNKDPLWKNDVWNSDGYWGADQPWGQDPLITASPVNPVQGVVSNPVLAPFGVTKSLSVSTDEIRSGHTTKFGALGSIIKEGDNLVNLHTGGSVFGVMTGLSITSKIDPHTGGALDHIVDKPIRVVGRYGIVTSVLKKCEYVKVRYKSLPPLATSLADAFSLPASMEDVLVNWIIYRALLDDSDASNINRANVFAQLYSSSIAEEKGRSTQSYATGRRKNRVQYLGGIIQ